MSGIELRGSISRHWPPFALAVVILLFIRSIARQIHRETRIKRLGSHAPQFGGRLPLGLSFLFDFRAHVSKDDALKFCNNTFVETCGGRKNPYTVEATILGQRIILTADPENVKAILATQFWNFGKGEKFSRDWDDLLGHSIFNSDGQIWHDKRSRLRPIFSRERISDLDCFERHVTNLLPLFGANGRTVDMKDSALRFTLDTSADFIIGADLESLKVSQNKVAEAFEQSRHFRIQRERSSPLKFLVPKKRYLPYIHYIESFMDPYIKETLDHFDAKDRQKQNGEKPVPYQRDYTLLHACVEISRDPRFLRDELLTAIVAGRDNTAMALTWTIYELARHPDVVDELRNTIEKTIGFEKRPSYQDIKDMKILSNMLSETLRLYPGVPFNTSSCAKPTTLPRGGGADGEGPIGVLPGTIIIMANHTLHLSPEAYTSTSSVSLPPEESHPSRWNKWFPPS